MCEQAPTFEKSGVRFAEDTPVVIPCVEEALAILSRQDEDPYVFQTLIYFFSTLLPGPHLSRPLDGRNIINVWWIRRHDLNNLYGLFYGSIQACRQVDAIITQLDPIAAYQQLQQLARAHLRGSPNSRSHNVGEEYTIVNRGHD